MKKTLIMMMGKSGSGKSYLERNLINLYPKQFKKVVSVTTRHIRQGEEDGKDYYFITQQQFEQMVEEHDLVQITEFAGNCYGSARQEYTTEHQYPILVVVPKSAATFIPIIKKEFPDMDIKIIYFNITDDKIRENMKSRGDDQSAIEVRLSHDTLDEDFKITGMKADFVIVDEMLDNHLPERIRTIIEEERNNG